MQRKQPHGASPAVFCCLLRAPHLQEPAAAKSGSAGRWRLEDHPWPPPGPSHRHQPGAAGKAGPLRRAGRSALSPNLPAPPTARLVWAVTLCPVQTAQQQTLPYIKHDNGTQKPARTAANRRFPRHWVWEDVKKFRGLTPLHHLNH